MFPLSIAEDHNKQIDFDELDHVLKEIGCEAVPAQEVKELFQESDLEGTGGLKYREFVLCMCLGTLLDPPLVKADHELAKTVREPMSIMVRAFLLFDDDASGFLDRKECEAAMDANADGGHAHAKAHKHSAEFFTKGRWDELDWDHDGTITFKEFFFAMETWAGIEDDEEE